MDFTLSVTISGLISTVLIMSALAVYYRRYREVSEQLTDPTRRSLSAFGLGIFFLALMGPTGLVEPIFSMALVSSLLACLIVAQLFLAVDDVSKVQRISVFVVVLGLIPMIESSARFLIPSYGSAIITMPILAVLLVTAIIGSIYVLKESPSPFTVSMLIILIFTLIAAVTASTGFITTTPQFFLLQILPIVVAAGVVGSMLRPWRNIITLTMLFLVLSVGPALFIPAFIANNMTVFLFAVALTFALLCSIIPLSFFLQQAVETSASTARYISLALISITLLAITHGNNYAIANSPIGAWDEAYLYFDWIIGVLAVGAFTMSAVATSFGTRVRSLSRELIVGFGSGLVVLGHPFVRWHDVFGDGTLLIQRWELDPLYLGVLSLLAVAFIIFFKLSYALWKVGSGRAGLRFVFFMFAALFLGIVAMFADMIPVDLLVPLFLFAGIMLLLSTPRRNPFTKA